MDLIRYGRKLFLVIAVLISNPGCRTWAEAETKSIGGELTVPSEEPAGSVVALRWRLDRNTIDYCTGVAIGARAVLTAAHCHSRLQPKMHLVLGENLFAPADSVDVLRWSPHERFSGLVWRNDIAVVLLTEPLPALRFVLTLADTPPQPEWNVVALGYGKGGDDDPQNRWGRLRRLEGRITSVDSERGTFRVRFPEGTGLCDGDSGGPAFVRIGEEYRLLGIYSNGEVDCINGEAEFTHVAHHREWITQTLNEP